MEHQVCELILKELHVIKSEIVTHQYYTVVTKKHLIKLIREYIYNYLNVSLPYWSHLYSYFSLNLLNFTDIRKILLF